MTKFRVFVTETRRYELTVEVAEEISEDCVGFGESVKTRAEQKAIEEIEKGSALPEYSAFAKLQVGEPWVRTHGWYFDRDDEPSGVLLFERALGHRFTKDDVNLLRARVEEIGFRVNTHWNGNGCDTLSIAASGRKGLDPLTKDQIAFLCRPREA